MSRRVLSEIYPMNTKMTGFRWFCASDKSSRSNERVKKLHVVDDDDYDQMVIMFWILGCHDDM